MSIIKSHLSSLTTANTRRCFASTSKHTIWDRYKEQREEDLNQQQERDNYYRNKPLTTRYDSNSTPPLKENLNSYQDQREERIEVNPFEGKSHTTRYDLPPHPHKPNQNQNRNQKIRKVPQGPSEAEKLKMADRRIARAERLERKDLTAQLTPTKTYMGGFTQPRHLAFLNPLDKTRKEKDSFEVRVGENRVRPSQEAYEPHVVYLATTLYPVRWGHGRATRREVFSGFCKETELKSTFDMLNGNWIRDSGEVFYDRDSEIYLKQAVWPGSPEARSLENKYKKAIAKEAQTIDGVVAKTPKFDISPPVVGWERPEPPFNSPRLIVPLLTITLPSRPLTSTLARLCQSFERGLPFYASVPNLDRKDGPGFYRRLLRMRMNRIKSLTEQIVTKLDGEGGGFFGLRLNSEDKGRGVEGEMLYENLITPKKGWAQLRWLESNSKAWEGLEREALMESWLEERVSIGKSWNDFGEAEDVDSTQAKLFTGTLDRADITEQDLMVMREGLKATQAGAEL